MIEKLLSTMMSTEMIGGGLSVAAWQVMTNESVCVCVCVCVCVFLKNLAMLHESV